MKKFWEDYQVLCEQTGEFYINHWKGIIVLNGALFGLGMAVAYVLDRKNQKEIREFEAKYCNYESEREG